MVAVAVTTPFTETELGVVEQVSTGELTTAGTVGPGYAPDVQTFFWRMLYGDVVDSALVQVLSASVVALTPV